MPDPCRVLARRLLETELMAAPCPRTVRTLQAFCAAFLAEHPHPGHGPWLSYERVSAAVRSRHPEAASAKEIGESLTREGGWRALAGHVAVMVDHVMTREGSHQA